jgi:Na+-transporting methylmalonyl-CoA/oxaloacetate decarboxylase gamma subunit
MSRSAKVGIVAVVGLFLAILIYSTLDLGRVTVEVCVNFKGRDNCGTAAAPSEEEAVRAATDNACALLTSGMTESMACSRTQPTSVRRLD